MKTMPADLNSKPLVPAELGVWIFILADMAVFTLYFWFFIWQKSTLPDLFTEGRATLNTTFGLLNTLILLTSSYFAAAGVEAARLKNTKKFRCCFRLTILCGAGFLVIKCAEYSEKFSAGLHIASNEFYTCYFAFTGFHLLHVIFGLSLLSGVLLATRDSKTLCSRIQMVEASAIYWHMVDLLWVVLFSLIYLVV